MAVLGRIRVSSQTSVRCHSLDTSAPILQLQSSMTYLESSLIFGCHTSLLVMVCSGIVLSSASLPILQTRTPRSDSATDPLHQHISLERDLLLRNLLVLSRHKHVSRPPKSLFEHSSSAFSSTRKQFGPKPVSDRLYSKISISTSSLPRSLRPTSVESTVLAMISPIHHESQFW